MKSRKQQSLISVCIPTYEMRGRGGIFLAQSLDLLVKQTFKNFDVVISDNSKTKNIEYVCKKYKNKLKISYYKNHDIMAGMATNINNAIKNANGKLVKILFQDDFLFNNNSLKIIADNFDLKKDCWLLTGYTHTRNGLEFFNPAFPKYNDEIHLGKNTIGSPSILTIKNDNPLLFDVRLKWLIDCDYYKRCYKRFGKPKIINKTLAVIRMGDHQVTNTEVNEIVGKEERNYLAKKHSQKPSGNLSLQKVTLIAVSGINPENAAKALELSMDGIDYYDVVLISHSKPKKLNNKITFRQCLSTELQSKDPKNKDDYSRFMIYNLCNYVDSDFALIVHDNAFVLRPYRWSDNFLKYDYVGAPWLKNIHFTKEGVNVRVGNGGFSLRSRKLLNIFNELKLPFIDNGTGYFNDDGLICVYYRKLLESHGIKFPSVSVASRFSHERHCDDSDLEPFGFHNNRKIIPKYFFLKHFLKKHMFFQ